MADNYQVYIQLFLIWAVSSILVRAILARKHTKNPRPPSPLALPVIGHLHLLAPIPHQALYKLSNRYGPIMHLFLGSVPCVVASSPEMAKEFLKTHETSFSNRPRTVVVDYLSYGSADFIFAPYGLYWKFMKKLCMSELLGGRALDQFLPVRQQETMRFLRRIGKKAEVGEVVDVGIELMRLTNNVISRMCTSHTCSETENEADDIIKLVKDIAEITGQFNLSEFFWVCKNLDLQGIRTRVKEIRDRFDTKIERIIKEHEEERRKRKKIGAIGETTDLIDILLEISEEESSDIRLTRENIKAFIMDIFETGTDASAVTTEWALAELINHPHIMEKVRQEIDSIVGQSRLVKESDIPNLPYLQATVKETLRLHPTGPLIMRESSESCTIGGYDIPAKTLLFVNVWAIGRDPKHWKNPLDFRPERFMQKEESGKNQMDVRGQHFQFLPFGSGRRGCPGTSMGLQLVQTNLAAMIQCFEWKAGGGNDIVDMEEGGGQTLRKAHPVICVPFSRLDSLPLT